MIVLIGWRTVEVNEFKIQVYFNVINPLTEQELLDLDGIIQKDVVSVLQSFNETLDLEKYQLFNRMEYMELKTRLIFYFKVKGPLTEDEVFSWIDVEIPSLIEPIISKYEFKATTIFSEKL
jgi:hypothetical protein